MSDRTVLVDEELPALEARGLQLVAKIPLLAITDAASFALAVEDRAEIKRRRARIAELMDPICTATHKTWKTAVAKREGLDAPFAEADKAYSRAMGIYEQAQKLQQREAEEAAKRERERLEAEERARVEVEQRRLTKEAEDRRLAEAAVAEARGDTETAERLITAPIAAPVVAPRAVFVPMTPTPAVPKAAGVSFRDNWTAVVDDLPALVRAVAEGTAAITLLQANQTALNSLARALKEALAIPGVRPVNERIAAQRNTVA